MSKRDEVLRGISEAAKVLAKPPAADAERTSFDVIGAIVDRHIPLLFRPLDKLWGAFVNAGAQKGIIVTSKLPLSVQRFTLAHELGHLLLGHEYSLDDTVEFAGRHAQVWKDPQEAGADAFAAELLASKQLVSRAAKRHRWTKAELNKPETIYQLSLRLGISYKAACWALVTAHILRRIEAEQLQETVVKGIKTSLMPPGLPRNSWADVWTLDQADTGTALEAGPDDLFAVGLKDHASAGYIWNLVDAEGDARIVGQHGPDLNHGYGERSPRTIYVEFNAPGIHSLIFEHVRPWSRSTLERIEVHVDDYGKERVGMSRREKHNTLRAAA